MGGSSPLILSLLIDDPLFTVLDQLRRKHFPPERNYLSAHVTLFHHLPGESLERVADDVQRLCSQTPSFELVLPKLRFLGKGVAIDVASPALSQLRSDLACQWDAWLTPQDRQRFSPHVTIQNKVEPAIAKSLFEKMSAQWTDLSGQAIGLSLWRYRGGPWEAAGRFNFGDGAS